MFVELSVYGQIIQWLYPFRDNSELIMNLFGEIHLF